MTTILASAAGLARVRCQVFNIGDFVLTPTAPGLVSEVEIVGIWYDTKRAPDKPQYVVLVRADPGEPIYGIRDAGQIIRGSRIRKATHSQALACGRGDL